MTQTKKNNSSWIAVGLLLGAFIFSAIRFFLISSHHSKNIEGESEKIIRVTHWQLEPGFRESMEWAIEAYNELPHVKAANVKIVQEPIPERVYNQVMNVHLISGTAPDIAAKAETKLIKGNALAKFYTPIGDYVNEPNPYNTKQYQMEGLPQELADSLENSSWRDTFFDGLQGGYIESLSDYYAVPICTAGGLRLFYNLDILSQVKAFARSEIEAQSMPNWLEPIIQSEGNSDGYLPAEIAFTWIQHDGLPETLGEFFVYCHAILAYAAHAGDSYMVPIAASSYTHNNLAVRYETEFLSGFWQDVDFDLGTVIKPVETISGYERKIWDFQSDAFVAYFDFVQAMSAFYPKGFLGLDREQAQRRFVLGQAAMIFTGGWDAQSIISGIEGRDKEEDRFEVEIALRPLPTENERWAEHLSMRINEANIDGGVPLAINKQTPHFEWALDFLKFLSSHRINEGFSHRAGWLPVIVGTKPPETIQSFVPELYGIPKAFALRFNVSGLPSALKNAWASSQKLYMSGDIDYPGMVERIESVLANSHLGVSKTWQLALQDGRDRSRANVRAQSVERLNAVLGDERAAVRERSQMYLGLIEDEGIDVIRWWNEVHPDVALPEY